MDALQLADRAVIELSGGERSRVLLADEPVHGLDPKHQISVMQLLKDLRGRDCLTIVTLHDLALATRWCDRLIVLSEGRVVADGDAGEVLSSKLLADVYGVEAATTVSEGRRLVVPVRLAGATARESGGGGHQRRA